MKRNDVENILIKMGIPAGIKGFKYIADSVLLLNENLDISITKKLYPEIAQKNKTTASRVERAIRHAFEVARSQRGNYAEVKHYIGFMNCQNSHSLKMLCLKIEQECDENCVDNSKNPDGVLTEEIVRKIIREELMKIMGGIA